MNEKQQFTKTVLCTDNKSLTKHFATQAEAVDYANELLAAGHKVRIVDYRPPKKYVDYLAERGKDG